MHEKQLSVRFYGEHIGVLKQTPNGKMKFNYEQPGAALPISIGMPLREEAYSNLECEAFFGGLLPENENTRQIIAKKYGVSPNNSFALLKAIGHDCAGAISFHELNEEIISMEIFPLKGKILSDENLYKHVKELPQKPLFIGDDLRLSLAGVQDKAPICVIENQVALPEQGCPTTHILKPSVAEYEGIIENEYFCLKLAEYVGLPVPRLEIRQIKDISFLLIERYDREINNEVVRCFHQEDFCQALKIVSSRKYQSEGGPGFKDCFELLKKTTNPVMDRNLLASALMFNFLIGNMDAHGKNFSLLHKGNSFIGLAPFYDLLCTRVYETLTTKMAMSIGGEYESSAVLAKQWEKLCADVNYSYPIFKRNFAQQVEAILKGMAIGRGSLLDMDRNIRIIDRIIKNIGQRIDRLSRLDFLK